MDLEHVRVPLRRLLLMGGEVRVDEAEGGRADVERYRRAAFVDADAGDPRRLGVDLDRGDVGPQFWCAEDEEVDLTHRRLRKGGVKEQVRFGRRWLLGPRVGAASLLDELDVSDGPSDQLQHVPAHELAAEPSR